jgi:Tol biopolymer transport system component
MTRDFAKQAWWGGVRRLAVLSLLGVGCKASMCGSGASGSGPLTQEERKAMPGVIAFISERAPQKDVWLVRPTGEETQLTRSPEDDYPSEPSPDGSALVVVATAEIGGAHVEQLRLVPLSGGEPVPLSEPRSRARNLSWAPDGSWFVVESSAEGFSDVVRQEPRAGAPVQRLAMAPEGNFEPSVSPDGTQVVFASSREGDPEIFVMKADGTDVRRLTYFHKEDMAPRWSPDGKWISFVSDREGRVRVFVVKPDGTGLRAVSGSANTGEEREPAWSPDGKKLAFVGRAGNEKSRVWVASVEGGEPVVLSDGKSVEDQPAWSPDGKYLVFVSERTGDAELFLMRADGSGQTQLTSSKGADWLPRWFVPKTLPPAPSQAQGT